MTQSIVTAETIRDKNEKQDVRRRVPVYIPQLFNVPFGLTPFARTHPSYDLVRQESEAWLEKMCCFTKSRIQQTHKHNFVFFTAVLVPDAPVHRFRLFSDWIVWIFAFDDLFDDGYLNGNVQGATDLGNSILATISGAASSQTDPPIIQAHADIWNRLKNESSTGVQQRYRQAMTRYIGALFKQMEALESGKLLTVEELMEERRETVASRPISALAEHCLKLQIPDDVFQHRIFDALRRLTCETLVIQNEIVSYRKEEQEDIVPDISHNLIGILRLSSMPAQAAFDQAGSMLEAIYQEWADIIAALPSWGEVIDQQVQLWIEMQRNQMRAHASWFFVSTRYFGDDTKAVKETLLTDVLMDLPTEGYDSKKK